VLELLLARMETVQEDIKTNHMDEEAGYKELLAKSKADRQASQRELKKIMERITRDTNQMSGVPEMEKRAHFSGHEI
jgi:hypothetical protein